MGKELTPAELETPPTEVEVAQLSFAAGMGPLTKDGLNILRRLAFHRNMLQLKLKQAVKGKELAEDKLSHLRSIVSMTSEELDQFVKDHPVDEHK